MWTSVLKGTEKRQSMRCVKTGAGEGEGGREDVKTAVGLEIQNKLFAAGMSVWLGRAMFRGAGRAECRVL